MADNLTRSTDGVDAGKAARVAALWSENRPTASRSDIGGGAVAVNLDNPLQTVAAAHAANGVSLGDVDAGAMWDDLGRDLAAAGTDGDKATAFGKLAMNLAKLDQQADEAAALADEVEDRATRFDTQHTREEMMHWDAQLRKMDRGWLGKRFHDACNKSIDDLTEHDALVIRAVLESADTVPLVETPMLTAGWNALRVKHGDAKHVEALRQKASTLRAVAATGRVSGAKRAQQLGLAEQWDRMIRGGDDRPDPKRQAGADQRFRSYGRTIRALGAAVDARVMSDDELHALAGRPARGGRR
jgi:hypothetical protein